MKYSPLLQYSFTEIKSCLSFKSNHVIIHEGLIKQIIDISFLNSFKQRSINSHYCNKTTGPHSATKGQESLHIWSSYFQNGLEGTWKCFTVFNSIWVDSLVCTKSASHSIFNGRTLSFPKTHLSQVIFNMSASEHLSDCNSIVLSTSRLTTWKKLPHAKMPFAWTSKRHFGMRQFI